jgi:hypothetical protein
MGDKGEPISQKENRFGGLSVLCLAFAAVGPSFSALALGLVKSSPSGGFDPGVLGIGMRGVFVLLALMFGFLGRRSRLGRLGLIGSGVLLAVVLAMTVFLVSRPAVAPVSPATIPSLPPPG